MERDQRTVDVQIEMRASAMLAELRGSLSYPDGVPSVTVKWPWLHEAVVTFALSEGRAMVRRELEALRFDVQDEVGPVDARFSMREIDRRLAALAAGGNEQQKIAPPTTEDSQRRVAPSVSDLGGALSREANLLSPNPSGGRQHASSGLAATSPPQPMPTLGEQTEHGQPPVAQRTGTSCAPSDRPDPASKLGQNLERAGSTPAPGASHDRYGIRCDVNGFACAIQRGGVDVLRLLAGAWIHRDGEAAQEIVDALNGGDASSMASSDKIGNSPCPPPAIAIAPDCQGRDQRGVQCDLRDGHSGLHRYVSGQDGATLIYERWSDAESQPPALTEPEILERAAELVLRVPMSMQPQDEVRRIARETSGRLRALAASLHASAAAPAPAPAPDGSPTERAEREIAQKQASCSHVFKRGGGVGFLSDAVWCRNCGATPPISAAPAPNPVDVFEATASEIYDACDHVCGSDDVATTATILKEWFGPLVEALEDLAHAGRVADRTAADIVLIAKRALSELRRKAQEAGQ